MILNSESLNSTSILGEILGKSTLVEVVVFLTHCCQEHVMSNSNSTKKLMSRPTWPHMISPFFEFIGKVLLLLSLWLIVMLLSILIVIDYKNVI